MANPLLAGVQPVTQKSANPLLSGAMPAPEAPKKLFPVDPAIAAAQEKLNTPETPGFLSTVGKSLMDNPLLQQVENFYNFTPQDSTTGQVGKAGAKAALAIPSLPLQAADLVSKQIADNQPVEGDSVITRVGKILKTQPPAIIGSAVKKLLFDPQSNLISEGVKQYGEGIKQAIDAHNNGAGIIDSLKAGETAASAGGTNVGLGMLPVAGPLIANTAEQIGTTGKVLGPTLELAGNAALLGAGAQEGRSVKARTAAINDFVAADLSDATQKGVAFDKNASLAKAKTLSTQDLVDTANAVKEQTAKNAVVAESKSRMAQASPEVAPTDVIPDTQVPEIKAKVPESNPAIPSGDLAAMDKLAAKRDLPTNQTGPQEGSPVPALLSDEEHAHLEKAGFTVDRQGRLARLVDNSRPSNPGAGQAALDPSANPTPVFTPEPPVQPKGLLSEGTPSGQEFTPELKNYYDERIRRQRAGESPQNQDWNDSASTEKSYPSENGTVKTRFVKDGSGFDDHEIQVRSFDKSGKHLSTTVIAIDSENPSRGVTTGLSTVEAEQGKGNAKSLYSNLSKIAADNGITELRSEPVQSDGGAGVWKSLVKDGLAKTVTDEHGQQRFELVNRNGFTTGDQPGANYSSEQLKAFKEKNGIATEPVQMVGEPKTFDEVATATREKMAAAKTPAEAKVVLKDAIEQSRKIAEGIVKRSPLDKSAGEQNASWVIRNKATKEVLFETFDQAKVKALNTAKYEAVPIQEYLGSINGQNEPWTKNGTKPTPTLEEVATKSRAAMAEAKTPEQARQVLKQTAKDSQAAVQGLKTNLLKGRRTGETGAVRLDALTSAPVEAAGKAIKAAGEAVSDGKGIAAAIGSEQKGELPKYAGSINLERLATPDDVKRTVLDSYEANKSSVDKARKVNRSFEQVKKDALDLGWDANKVTAKKGAMTDSQIQAARQVTLGINEEVTKLRADYSKDPSPKNLIAVQEALSRSAAVNQSMQGASAEAGRALNAHKILAQALRESQTDVQKAMETVRKSLGDKWEENQKAVVETLSRIPEGDTRRLNKFIRNYAQFTTKDKIYAYYLANILSGVQTNVKNFVGNSTMIPLETATKAIRGIGNKDAYSSEAFHSVVGRWQGLEQGLQSAFQIMRDGMSSQQASKLEIPQRFEFTGMGKAWNYPGRLLEASDAIFKATSMNGELRALAARQALKEGLKGNALDKRIQEIVSNPPEGMVNKAVAQAKYETFTTDPGAWTKAIIDARQKVTPLKYVIPFINVPTNLLKVGMEYSPAGFLKAPREVIMGKLTGDEVRSKYLKTPEARDAFARASIGSAIAFYAWQKYQEGGLTGKAPSDAGQRDAFLRTRQEYSVKVGDKWVRYTDFGPLAIPFLMTAAVEDARQQNKNFPADKVAAEAVGSLARGIFQQSFYKGLSDVMDTFGSGTGSFGNAVTKQAAGTTSGMVPFSGLFRSVKNVNDPFTRDPDGMYERLKSGLPIFSETVPSKLNALGEETKNSRLNGILGFGLRDTKIPNLDIEKELSRLEVSPAVPSTSLNISSSQFELTRDQKRELTDLLGQARKQTLRELFSDGQDVTLGKGSDRETLVYSKMDDEQKRKAINHVLDDAQKAARDEFINRVNSRNEAVKEKPKKAKLLFVGAE